MASSASAPIARSMACPHRPSCAGETGSRTKPGSASAALCSAAGDAGPRSKACRHRPKIGKGPEKAHPPQEAVLEGQDESCASRAAQNWRLHVVFGGGMGSKRRVKCLRRGDFQAIIRGLPPLVREAHLEALEA